MFDKFGEFDSVEEINKAAAGFKTEGDIKSLYELAEENGIDKEDVQDYIDGDGEFATAALAASGRIDIEEKSLTGDTGKKMAMEVIFLMLRGMCAMPELQEAVIRKGKRAKEIYEEMKAVTGKHATGDTAVCCGTDRQLRKLIQT